MKFEGRLALVTGGSRGIGRATALKLAEEGADVAVNFVRAKDRADEVCHAIWQLGRKAIAVQADIADRTAVNEMVGKIQEEMGTVSLLVNNAGTAIDCDFNEIEPEQWDALIALNLTGTFNVIWAFKDGMIGQNFGRIVNISSIAPLANRPRLLAYAAAKAGVNSLTKSCCEPFAKHNIRINGVAPGIIDTELVQDVSPEMVAQMSADTPLGRLGRPEEIADAVIYLLSEQSSYMTGATMIVSGGRLLVP